MDKLEFSYDAAVKELTAVEDGFLTFAIQGGGGGAGANFSGHSGSRGGDGTLVTGGVWLKAGEKVYCAVGNGGLSGVSYNGGLGGNGVENYYGGTGQSSTVTYGGGGGGGGGGATLLWKKENGINKFIAIAAGGGGGGGAGTSTDGIYYSETVYKTVIKESSASSWIDGYPSSGGGPAIGFGALSLQPVSQSVYNARGTYSYTVPSGVTTLSLLAVGGGGSGTSSAYYTASGGSAGSIATSVISVSPGDTITVEIGKGGDSVINNIWSETVYGNQGDATRIYRNGSLIMTAAGGAGSSYVNSSWYWVDSAGASRVFNSETIGVGGAAGTSGGDWWYMPTAGGNGGSGAGGGSAVGYENRSGAGGDGYAIVRLSNNTIASISGNKVRFDVGVAPLLRNFKPDNCSAPTGDIIFIGKSVTQQQLTNLGIVTPKESLISISAGDVVSWSESTAVDHNLQIGYWIWNANSIPTSALTASLYHTTYGANGRQWSELNSSFTVPSSFTDTSVLVMGIGDVSSSGATGMHSTSFYVTAKTSVTEGQTVTHVGIGGNGGGGAGNTGGGAYPSSSLAGTSGSRGLSLNTAQTSRFILTKSLGYANTGVGGTPSGTQNGGSGYAAFSAFRTNVNVSSNSTWIEAKDVKVRINGQWRQVEEIQVKNGQTWNNSFKTFVPAVTNKTFNLN